MKDMESKIKVLALFGKSSAGKDTIQKWMVKNLPHMHGIISYTTRPSRDYERHGVDYYFLSEADFEQKKKDKLILESTEFRGWHYGTGVDQLSQDGINVGVFNIAGIKQLLKDSRLEVLPVYISANDKVRLMRSLNREHFPNCTEICRRFLADAEDFKKVDCNIEDFTFELYDNSEDSEYYRVQNLPLVKEFIGQN